MRSFLLKRLVENVKEKSYCFLYRAFSFFVYIGLSIFNGIGRFYYSCLEGKRITLFKDISPLWIMGFTPASFVLCKKLDTSNKSIIAGNRLPNVMNSYSWLIEYGQRSSCYTKVGAQ